MVVEPDAQTARTMSPESARATFHAGLNRTTSGWADGWVQCNLLSVEKNTARDLMIFAQRNPKACPLLDVLEPGQYSSSRFRGDVRTDLPGYVIYEDGKPPVASNNGKDFWKDEFYTFLIGCSFTFENAFRRLGVPVRHDEDGRTVPMYRTNIDCAAAGRLSGPLVVTLRYMPAALVADAVRISSRYPSSHGAPVHVGDPAELGIEDVSKPDWGDPPVKKAGDVPMFWACGVTPQAVVMSSNIEYAIAHEPGRMAIMDIAEESVQAP
ncbi:putative hydro-lyase [Rothia uropygialis]|uniref:putative hydro-lyase n=1 Tax=Kocuria sp. 36 TaxID=1415402 RepID=UPI001930F7F4|nr:putative hydro-lyase [Kocuria sp. 36]